MESPMNEMETRDFGPKRRTVYNGDLTTGSFFQPRHSPFPESSRRTFRCSDLEKLRRRAIFRNGDTNILHCLKKKSRMRYVHDLFTTLVDTKWRYTLVIFSIAFFASWLFFSLIWWLIAFCHGDLEPEHLPMNQAENNWIPCIFNIHGFTSSYLFSLETQFTTGYGVRTTTEECPEAIFIMSMQCIIGMLIEAFAVGIMFAKMTRPKLRTQTLLFSKNVVVYQREDHLCLMFRVGDMRKTHIIGATIRAQFIGPKETKEGEYLPDYQTKLSVSADDNEESNLVFIWPMTIVHKIDENSPLYDLSSSDMIRSRFEIVVVLEGIVESTGQTVQARSSYIPNDIQWGYRFEPIVTYNEDRHGYEINYSKFDNIYPVDTPLCSAAEIEEFYKAHERPSEPSKLKRSASNTSLYSSASGRHKFQRAKFNYSYENLLGFGTSNV